MQNKIFFHAGQGGNRTGIGTMFQTIDSRGRSFAVKSVDDPGLIAEALSYGTNHTVVLRFIMNQEDAPLYHLPPLEAANIRWRQIKTWIDNATEIHPFKEHIYIEPINEPRTQINHDDPNYNNMHPVDWLGVFGRRLADHITTHGYKVAMFAMNTGTPEPEDWLRPQMAAFLRFAAERGNIAISLHEAKIDPNNQYTFHDPVSHFVPHSVGRFQNLIDACKQLGITPLPIFISEWAWGYNDMPEPHEARGDILWMMQNVYNHPAIQAVFLWTLHGGSQWSNLPNKLVRLIPDITQITTTIDFPSQEEDERGKPRDDYERAYWVINKKDPTLSEYLEICKQAYTQKRTVGFSFDDSGVGDLTRRNVTVWGDDIAMSALRPWYEQNYPGVKVTFKHDDGTESGPFTTGTGNGKPRVQYARTYHRVHDKASLSEYLAVCQIAFVTRGTVGFSVDDACIGDLDQRIYIEYGNQYGETDLKNFISTYYPGVQLRMQEMPETGYGLTMPLSGQYVITSRFNAYRTYGKHEGVDFGIRSTGARVIAAREGRVSHIGYNGSGYGHYLIIEHRKADGSTFSTWYAHLATKPSVSVGQQVSRSQILGVPGSTGLSSGVHLHFNLQDPGKGLSGYIIPDVLDPLPHIDLTVVPVSSGGGGYSGPSTSPFIRGVDQPASDWHWPVAKAVFEQTGLFPKFHTSGASHNWYNQFKNSDFNPVRVVIDRGFTNRDPAAIWNEMKGEIAKFYNLGARNFIFLNEPNTTHEHLGKLWDNGTQFGQTFRKLCEFGHAAYPGIMIWFPGCSPGFGAQHTFINEAKAAGAFDLIYGVVEHVYTGITDNTVAASDQMYNEILDFQKRHTLTRPLMIGEFSVNRSAPASYKADVYHMLYIRLANTPGIKAAYSFTSSWYPNPDTNREGWYEHGIYHYF